ncbi:transmembrane protein, putative, partial [Bodo saltans]
QVRTAGRPVTYPAREALVQVLFHEFGGVGWGVILLPEPTLPLALSNCGLKPRKVVFSSHCLSINSAEAPHPVCSNVAPDVDFAIPSSDLTLESLLSWRHPASRSMSLVPLMLSSLNTMLLQKGSLSSGYFASIFLLNATLLAICSGVNRCTRSQVRWRTPRLRRSLATVLFDGVVPVASPMTSAISCELLRGRFFNHTTITKNDEGSVIARNVTSSPLALEKVCRNTTASNQNVTDVVRPSTLFPQWHRVATVVLLEYAAVWYATLDVGVLTAVSILGAVGTLESDAACRGSAVAVMILYVVQFAICAAARPFTTLFSHIYALVTLALAMIAIAMIGIACQVWYVFEAEEGGNLDSMSRLLLAAAVCDLLVSGISLLKTVLDVGDALKALRRLFMEGVGIVELSSSVGGVEDKDMLPPHLADDERDVVEELFSLAGSVCDAAPHHNHLGYQQDDDANDERGMLMELLLCCCSPRTPIMTMRCLLTREASIRSACAMKIQATKICCG